jgi:hypothetical protein
MKRTIISILSILTLVSCNENTLTSSTQEIQLKPNEKFINITWKDSDIWVITQDTLTGIYYAREKSTYGVLEGEIIVTSDKQVW